MRREGRGAWFGPFLILRGLFIELDFNYHIINPESNAFFNAGQLCAPIYF